MRIGTMLASLSVGLLGAGSVWAQASPSNAVTEAPSAGPPAPPVAGYPPPPPGGYPPPPPGGYPPPPPGGYPPPPGYGPEGYGPAAPVERTANNALYLELLGPSILYSLNYDRVFGDFAGRVGISYLPLSGSAGDSNSGGEAHVSLVTVPITVSYIGIGSKKHMFELGGGATILHVGAGASIFAVDEKDSASTSATLVLGNFIFGYRLQPPTGGFMLRTGLSPVFGAGVFIPLPYLALGGTF